MSGKTAIRIAAALCLAIAVVPNAIAKGVQPGVTTATPRTAADYLDKAAMLVSEGQSERAISDYLDIILLNFKQELKDEKSPVYSARTPAEALFYTSQAAKHHQKALVLNNLWSETLYLKGYALIDLGRLDDAEATLEMAVMVAPKNARVLAELGLVHQLKKDYSKTLDLMKRAADAAKTYSPPEVRNSELAHAWRGTAYVFVEQGRLSEAEKLYKKCLKLDPNDSRAKSELEYLNRLRASKR